MNGDPKYFIVTCFDEEGRIILFEIEDTPLDTQLKASADAGTSVIRGVGALLYIAAHILPDSVAKFHAFKALHTLIREAQALEDRMTAAPRTSEDELPF